MRRLVYRRDARDNLADIHRYILQESTNRETATKFTKQLRDHCEKIARLKNKIGRPRDELDPGIRSIVHKNYVIFFRYVSDRIEIVNVLHGHRDLEAYFERKVWGIKE